MTADDCWLTDVLAVSPAVLLRLAPEADFAVTHATSNAREVIGHDPEQVVGDPSFWTGHLEPDDLLAFHGRLASLEPGSCGRGEYRLTTGWGEVRWFQMQFRLVAGARRDAVAASLIDITDRRKLAVASRGSRARAVRAERLLGDALESLSETFIIFDADRKFVACK